MLLAGLGLGLAGCAAAPLRSYVLAVPGPVQAAPVTVVPAQTIELRPVLLPDHLDTSAMLRRNGSELVASRNGRWADRLSVGIRLALAADLQALRPDVAVVTSAPVGAPAGDVRRVSLDVDSVDLDAGGTLSLDARWTVETTRPPAVLARRQVRLLATGVGGGDAAQVAAMQGLLAQLAGSIARGL